MQRTACLFVKRDIRAGPWIDSIDTPFATGEARPMLIAAEKSLKALNRNDITEVKAMKRPPLGVLLVIEAICIINNVKPIKVRRCLRKRARISSKLEAREKSARIGTCRRTRNTRFASVAPRVSITAATRDRARV